jgi:beta-lactamase class D
MKRRLFRHHLALLLLGISFGLLPAWAGPPAVVEPDELWSAGDAAWLEGREVVFYAEDLATGQRYAYQRKKINERHAPFSSFKIPNLLIALETGVAGGLDHPVSFNPARRPPQSYWPADWAQDQTLETAFRRSTAWYFQDLSLLISSQTYRGYLGHFGYGNQEVAEGSDSFWLDGTLKVSAKEQASFLRRLLIGQLEVSPRNIDLLAQVSAVKTSGDMVLHGKTGAGPRKSGDFDGPFDGWFVGWLERPGNKPVVFALWAAAPSFSAIKTFRQEAAENMLGRIGVWPPTSTP